jgi:arylsulfatase A-like enzyme
MPLQLKVKTAKMFSEKMSCGASRRQFLQTCAGSAAGLVSLYATSGFAAPRQSRGSVKPNIIFILSDDLGWGDVGFTADLFDRKSNHPRPPTPNLDRLAGEGVIFSQFYAAHCVCTPTRVSAFTGIKSEKLGIHYVGPVCLDGNSGIPWGMPNSANMLSLAGYSTGFIGKWGMGSNDPESIRVRADGGQSLFPGPNDCGFEDAAFFDDSLDNSSCHRKHDLDWSPTTVFYKSDQHPDSSECTFYNDRHTDLIAEDTNLVQHHFDWAIHFIDKYAERPNPFFIMLWDLAPHVPIERIPPYDQQCGHISADLD